MRAENIEQRFRSDIAEHELQVLRDDGLYRHLRCQRPDTICYYFDIVTWPGYLAYVGDMGSYMFSRTRDMFGFFESDSGRINPDYWAEKLQAEQPRPGEVFSERAYEAAVREWRDQVIEDRLLPRYMSDCDQFDSWLGLGVHGPLPRIDGSLRLAWCLGQSWDEVVYLSDLEKLDDFKHEVDWQLLRSEPYSEERAYHLLSEFEWKDGYSDKHPIRIDAAWDELGSFREYEFRFLWCCHALVWAIGKYREYEREAVAA